MTCIGVPPEPNSWNDRGTFLETIQIGQGASTRLFQLRLTNYSKKSSAAAGRKGATKLLGSRIEPLVPEAYRYGPSTWLVVNSTNYTKMNTISGLILSPTWNFVVNRADVYSWLVLRTVMRLDKCDQGRTTLAFLTRLNSMILKRRLTTIFRNI